MINNSNNNFSPLNILDYNKNNVLENKSDIIVENFNI